MKVVYSPRYCIDIGLHVFPTAKYGLIHQRLIQSPPAEPVETVEPFAATWDDLALVHTTDFLERMRTGSMTREDVAQLELPWSTGMVDGFRLMAGGTILAGRLACAASGSRASNPAPRPSNPEPGAPSPGPASTIVVHLGGGLHHAFPNHGEGFCPFNDVAAAVRVLQRDRLIDRAAIVDLDVHHGNGTAFIFESDPRVFTFSMHQQHNYPMWKPRSSLDIGLADGTRDAAYLFQLTRALPSVLAERPGVVFYLAGADPYEDDQLGGLRLTKDGLRRRDRFVIEAVTSADIPLVVVLAGGYARHVEDTVEIHCATVEEAAVAARRN